jgi:hypothetical protein
VNHEEKSRENIMSDLVAEFIGNVLALFIVLACIYFPLRWALLFTKYLERKWGE